MTDVLATAADASYGYHALNLIGSVKRNSDVFDRIEVFDLGLSPHQRELIGAVPGVVVRLVPPFSSHWSQCFTWKPWAWMQTEAERVFWIDAGASVLRSLGDALAQIDERGYFLVSQGGALGEIAPPDYFTLYDLPEGVGVSPYVCAGILGYRPDGVFFEKVLVPTYEDCVAGRNLGFSADEFASKNRGIGYMESAPVRDCRQFRWDQTILNLRLLQWRRDVAIADLDEYGGWRSAHDHPAQVIWHHRRRGALRYLKHVPYSGVHAWRRRAFGAWFQLRWWLVLHRHLLAPSTVTLAKRVALRRARKGLVPAPVRGLLRPLRLRLMGERQREVPAEVPHGPEKWAVVREYARRFGTRIFVETGTYLGDTTAAVRREFDRVYTIELHDELYRRARGRFALRPSVHVIHGDSAEELERLLPELDEPTLFWLDAHYSRGGVISARGRYDPPLAFELQAILALRDSRHVILIDDTRLLGRTVGYPTLEQITELVSRSGLDLIVESERDILRIHRPDSAD